MTTSVKMGASMEAWLRAAAVRAFRKSETAFDRALTTTMTQPMPTLSDTTTFRITTPGDGAREFVFTVSLTESGTATATPTTGWDFKGQ
jgi:hypothetical protein